MAEKEFEDIKKQITEQIAESYLSKGDNIEALIEGDPTMDEFSKDQLLGEVARIYRERDPQAKHEGISQLFATVKNRYGWQIGRKIYLDKFSDLDRDKQFQMATQLGTIDLEEYLSPGSSRRRGH